MGHSPGHPPAAGRSLALAASSGAAQAGWRLWLLAALAITAYNCSCSIPPRSVRRRSTLEPGQYPPAGPFIGAGLLLGEWPARRAWVGLLLALFGLLWLICQGDWRVLASLSFAEGRSADGARHAGLGALFAAAAALECLTSSCHPFTLLGALVLLGLLMLAPFYAWELWQGARFELSSANLAADWLHRAVRFSGGLSAVEHRPARGWCLAYRDEQLPDAGVHRHPRLGLLDERLQGYHWVGGALIVSGLLLAGRGRAQS